MSYEPNPSGIPAPPYAPAPLAPAAGVAAGSGRSGRRRGAVLGPLLIVAGLLGAVVAYLAINITHRKRVENLERVVSGYSTTLTFEKAGTFHLYYEYDGEFTAVVDGQDETIDISAGEQRPDFTATLRDDTGSEIPLTPDDSGVSYDVAGFKGRAFRTAAITSPGEYTLDVVPAAGQGSEFAIALGIGRVRAPSLVLPIMIAALGLVAGLLVMMFGRRGDSPSPAGAGTPQAPVGATSPPWQPAPSAPAGPYVSPPPPPAQPPGPYVPPAPAPTPPSVPTPPAPTPPAPTPPTPLPPPVWGPPQV